MHEIRECTTIIDHKNVFIFMLDSKIYFVSGIDTDAGKSYATGWLAANWGAIAASDERDTATLHLRVAATPRVRVITQKLIQTGCAPDKVSEDIITHRRLMGTELLPEDLNHTTCALRFAYPASPHLAAAMEGRFIDLSLADRATAALLESYDTVLVEGAGGLMVPIFEKGASDANGVGEPARNGIFARDVVPARDDYYMIDYAAERHLPLILVTSARLGSLNHTLLSLEACRTRGVQVALVAYNLWGETSPEITASTRDYLARNLAKHHPDCTIVDIPIIRN